MKNIRALRYALHVIVRPFDGFWDLKHEKRGNVTVATTLLILATLTFVLLEQYTGFLLKTKNPMDFNIFVECSSVVFPFVLWCAANWCLTTLMDGKGTFKDIYIATSYALTPIILIYLPTIVLSNVIVIEEAVFYLFFLTIANIWCGALLIIGNMCTHDYSFGKTIMTCFCTIVGIGLMIFIMLLFFNLIEQIVVFVSTLYKEIIFRL